MPISSVEPDLPYVMTKTCSIRASPRPVEGAALVEAGSGLDPDQRALVELGEVAAPA